ncbi:MAG: PorT family protein [Muribaculaceae bacterium]|nr:PorT family protein [Muribaculaceae bacterium]
MDDKWLDILKNRMAGYEADEPPGLWRDIDRRMRVSPNASKSRRSAVVMRVMMSGAVAAVLLLLLGVGWFTLYDGGDVSSPVRLVASAPDADKADKTVSDVDDRVVSKPMVADNGIAARKSSGRNMIAAYKKKFAAQSDGDVEVPIAAKSASGSAVPVAKAKNRAQAADSSNSEPTTVKEIVAMGDVSTVRRDYGNKMAKRAAESGKISVGAYATNLTSYDGGNVGAQEGNRLWAIPRPAYDYYSSSSNKIDKEVLMKLSESDLVYSHRQPVRLGVSVDYGITERLSLSTGLVYSYLLSDVKGGIGSNSYDATQRLHYLGLPLEMRFRVLDMSRFSFYLSAGAMSEICLKGSRKAVRKMMGEPDRYELTDARVRPLQWSLKGGAGVDFRLFGNVKLYVEPGVSYYFDNHSKVSTIYGERPFNFDLNVGVRFGLGAR